MNIGVIVGIGAGLVSIIGFLGTVIALIFKAGKGGGNMESTLKDLTNACQMNTSSISKLEKRQEETDQTVAVLLSDNKRTTDSIIRLFDKIDKNHEVVMSHLIDLKGERK